MRMLVHAKFPHEPFNMISLVVTLIAQTGIRRASGQTVPASGEKRQYACFLRGKVQ